MLLKRHRKKTIQRLVRPHRQWLRLVQVIIPQPEPEEIANRCFHAGRAFPIPIHAQHQRLQMIRIVAGNRDPNMTDQPGPSLVEQRKSLPGRNAPRVRIPPRAVIAGNPLLHIILSLRQRRNQGGRTLRDKRKCQKAKRNYRKKFFQGILHDVPLTAESRGVVILSRLQRRRNPQIDEGTI